MPNQTNSIFFFVYSAVKLCFPKNIYISAISDLIKIMKNRDYKLYVFSGPITSDYLIDLFIYFPKASALNMYAL